MTPRREQFDLATVRDLRTPLDTGPAGIVMRAAWARQRFYRFAGQRMFDRRSLGGRRWKALCTLCSWEGSPMGAGRHARDRHGSQLLDLNTPGMLERYLVKEAAHA